MPTEVEAALSKDIQLLYRCAKAVVSRDCSRVARREHGVLNLARWYTTQSRVLRLNMSTTRLSAKLLELTRYIVRVYVPTVMDTSPTVTWSRHHATSSGSYSASGRL